jgi:3-hydroxyacyl-CoA dehydrogenase
MDAENVKKVAVIGAGVMGHSIAQVFAAAEIEVNLVDRDSRILEHAVDLTKAELETLAEYGKISHGQIPKILSRIHPTTDIAQATKNIEFALEAVSEEPGIKKTIFAQLDQFCSENTVLASNTSTLDIFNIVEIDNPHRLVAAHWFAPPNIVPLVEIAPGPDTSAETVAFTETLMQRLGKKTVVMEKFVPALIVNRIQNSIFAAVFELLSNGWATPEEIDIAVKSSLGVRLPVVGVVQTLDFTGLDLVADITRAHGGENSLIEEKVKQGHLGAKTSKGMYDYGRRSQSEIIKKRDLRYLQNLDHLLKINAFEPI